MSRPDARERLVEVDIWRAFAILAVIFIHIEGGSIYFFKQGSLTFSAMLVWDQFLRFAVPLFVFISGFVLTTGYLHEFNLWNFIKKRVLRILPWYFFFSLVIYIYTRIIFPEKVPHFPLWELIFLGKTDYHLYFVSMIFQLYLLFPLLLWLFKRSWKPLLILSFIFEAIVYFISSLNAQGIIKLPFVWYDQQQYVFFGSWIFYFILGMVFSIQNMEKIFDRIKKYLFILLILFFILTAWDTFRLLRFGDVVLATRSTRIPVLFYTVDFLALLFVYRKKLLLAPELLKRLLVRVGRNSYIIYLCHTLVLRLISKFFLPNHLANFFLFSIISIVISILFAEVCITTASFLKKTFYGALRYLPVVG